MGLRVVRLAGATERLPEESHLMLFRDISCSR
jgi:hypothetical protein